MTIAEPDVTLTDYALTLECAVLAWLLHRERLGDRALRRSCVIFFAAIGLASLMGGTVHGFAHDQSSLLHVVLWKTTLLAIGTAALAAWMMGSHLLSRESLARRVRDTAVALFAAYALAVAFVDSFLLAVAHYLPAALFLLLAFWLRYLKDHRPSLLWGVTGLLLTFVAAAVQQLGVGLHRVWFNHNALYHVIQAVALLFLFVASRGIIRERETGLC
ncbi:MAG: hypothetical protein R3286_04880 [Gammaproteobacteria bacterium]|nr:hypothetical protein [Gammaproteobacteria bacterium]